MVFVPNVTESGLPTNNTFTYTQTRSGTVQESRTQNLVKTGSAAISPIDSAFDSTGTYDFSTSQATYGRITLVTVAGGGGGGSGSYGGGGGGGQVIIGDGTRDSGTYVISPGVANLVVGLGGAVGTAGANSYVTSNGVTLFNALGGGGGNATHGGSSGAGRTGGLPGERGSGGGAGYSVPFPDGTINPGAFDGGDGESGLSVTIDTAFDAFYGGGGGGGYDGAAGPGRFGNGSRRSARGGGGYGNAQPGLDNSGGGGGGGGGAAGGSGRIILKIR